MDRVMMFLFPMICFLGLFLLGKCYEKFFIMKKCKEKIRSIAWVNRNKVKAYLIAMPLFVISGPAIEELIFRAPLLIFFDEISTNAWWAIIFSGAIFALLHYFNNKVSFSDLVMRQNDDNVQSDNMLNEIKRVGNEMSRWDFFGRKVFPVVVAFSLGVLIAYLGIAYQSLWLCLLVHGAWNLIMPTVLPILLLIVWIVALVPCALVVRVARFFKKRIFRKKKYRFFEMTI
ncbi:MAG: CPBP family intramembrane glutamic endopeptidase [Patescibacteria group bacterium]